eukprot:SAG31_NODE_5172_length_2700_cov_4.400231_2_plen_248_part_00
MATLQSFLGISALSHSSNLPHIAVPSLDDGNVEGEFARAGRRRQQLAWEDACFCHRQLIWATHLRCPTSAGVVGYVTELTSHTVGPARGVEGRRRFLVLSLQRRLEPAGTPGGAEQDRAPRVICDGQTACVTALSWTLAVWRHAPAHGWEPGATKGLLRGPFDLTGCHVSARSNGRQGRNKDGPPNLVVRVCIPARRGKGDHVVQFCCGSVDECSTWHYKAAHNQVETWLSCLLAASAGGLLPLPCV